MATPVQAVPVEVQLTRRQAQVFEELRSQGVLFCSGMSKRTIETLCEHELAQTTSAGWLELTGRGERSTLIGTRLVLGRRDPLVMRHFVIEAGPIEVQCDVVARNDGEAGRILTDFLRREQLIGSSRWTRDQNLGLEEPDDAAVYNIQVFWRGYMPEIVEDAEPMPCDCNACRGPSVAQIVGVDDRRVPSSTERRRMLAREGGFARGPREDVPCTKAGS